MPNKKITITNYNSLYTSEEFVFTEGVPNILIGPNGIGKTYLCNSIQASLEKNHRCKKKIVFFSNTDQGGAFAREKFGFTGQYSILAKMLNSSEGQCNILSYKHILLADLNEKLIEIKEDEAHNYSLWLIIDAIDSGWDIINIRKFLRDMDEMPSIVKYKLPNIKAVYILITANAYAMVKGRECIDIYHNQRIKFDDYDSYEEWVSKVYEEMIIRDGKRKEKATVSGSDL